MPDWFDFLTVRALTKFIIHLFINTLVKIGYKKISNVLLNIFLHRLIFKIMYGYPKREKKSGLRTKIKSFHSGY